MTNVKEALTAHFPLLGLKTPADLIGKVMTLSFFQLENEQWFKREVYFLIQSMDVGPLVPWKDNKYICLSSNWIPIGCGQCVRIVFESNGYSIQLKDKRSPLPVSAWFNSHGSGYPSEGLKEGSFKIS